MAIAQTIVQGAPVRTLAEVSRTVVATESEPQVPRLRSG